MGANGKYEFMSDVILVDSSYLDFVVGDMKRYFEPLIGRELGLVDLSELISCIALDASMGSGESAKQVLMVYDKKSCLLKHCSPSDISSQLDGKAFNSEFGEFLFSGISSENMVTTGDLLVDVLSLVADSDGTKRIAIIADEECHGKEIDKVIVDSRQKTYVRFAMRVAESNEYSNFEVLAYPVMHALGITADEIK